MTPDPEQSKDLGLAPTQHNMRFGCAFVKKDCAALSLLPGKQSRPACQPLEGRYGRPEEPPRPGVGQPSPSLVPEKVKSANKHS